MSNNSLFSSSGSERTAAMDVRKWALPYSYGFDSMEGCRILYDCISGGTLQGISREIYEAAKVDGAAAIRKFFLHHTASSDADYIFCLYHADYFPV